MFFYLYILITQSYLFYLFTTLHNNTHHCQGTLVCFICTLLLFITAFLTAYLTAFLVCRIKLKHSYNLSDIVTNLVFYVFFYVCVICRVLPPISATADTSSQGGGFTQNKTMLNK